jgi:hypothetical protein
MESHCRKYISNDPTQYGKMKLPLNISPRFFMSLIGLLGLLFTLFATIKAFHDAHHHNRSYLKEVLDGLAGFPRLVIGFIAVWLWYIPIIFFRLLPLCFKSRSRYARRFALKSGQALANKTEVKMRHIMNKDVMKSYMSGEGAPTELADFLSIYDILILIAEDLHYVDVLNLGLTSKSVREAVLPSSAASQRLNHFRMYTCEPQTKSQCWVCTNQVCEPCGYSRALKQRSLYYHLDVCRPYCNKCYFRNIQKKPQRIRAETPVCACAPPPDHPNWFTRYMNGKLYYTSRWRLIPNVGRVICQQCNVLSNDEILEKRKKRTKVELRDVKRKGMEKCAVCHEELRGGPSWWVCTNCKKECTSFLHAAWGGKRGREKEGPVVGEQAV